jgi:precorrin-2/cobalt-factor-2 C20-methyltransferase
MPGERVTRLVDAGETDCPYFAIVLVYGQGQRTKAAE